MFFDDHLGYRQNVFFQGVTTPEEGSGHESMRYQRGGHRTQGGPWKLGKEMGGGQVWELGKGLRGSADTVEKMLMSEAQKTKLSR